MRAALASELLCLPRGKLQGQARPAAHLQVVGSHWSLKQLVFPCPMVTKQSGGGGGLSLVASVPILPKRTTLSAQPCTLRGLSW